MLDVKKEKLKFILFLVLLILMPMHNLVFSKLLGDIKILSLWRDVIILYLALDSIRKGIKVKFLDISIIFTIFIIVLFAISRGNLAVLNIARTYCVPLLIYFYTSNKYFTDEEIEVIIRVNLYVATLIAVWGIIQAFILGP